jgi:hypothetical protein
LSGKPKTTNTNLRNVYPHTRLGNSLGESVDISFRLALAVLLEFTACMVV